jgi:hypothetical protein
MDIVPSDNRPIWKLDSSKQLPGSTIVGLMLGLAIVFTLTLVVSLFLVNYMGGEAFVVKVVGMTVTPYGNDMVDVTLISGEDIDDLKLLEVYLNGVWAQPVSLPQTYKPGISIYYKIPPDIGSGGYSVSVVGLFSDGNSVELYTTAIS